jgi:hypothetical protein
MSGKVYKILCFGDSNTYGFDPRMGAPEQLPYEKRWTGILDAMPCYQVINRGQNGREIPHTQSAFASLEYTLERHGDADVLVITEDRVFSLEFKMKDKVDPDEVSQAAKYLPYLEIVFGTDYEVIPALVLTTASELFEFASIGKSDFILPVCSGDMLFNVFDEYLGFLSDDE